MKEITSQEIRDRIEQFDLHSSPVAMIRQVLGILDLLNQRIDGLEKKD